MNLGESDYMETKKKVTDKISNTQQNSNGSLLSLNCVRAGYGAKEILHRVSLTVRAGSIVTMIGPNGSGKSTILKTIFGLVKAREGSIEFDGKSCLGSKSSELIEHGLVYLPQGNQVFPDLSVLDNLTVSLRGVSKAETKARLDRMAEWFPLVKERMRQPAGRLSGGEKQQVALALALMKKPHMLLLDEPSLGLAPNLLGAVFSKLKSINREMGVTILVVEHKVREVFKIADWVLGLQRGKIIDEGAPNVFGNRQLKNLFLG